MVEAGKQVPLGTQALVGADRDLDTEKPGRKPASRNPGNKVNRGPFIRKPRFSVSRAQALWSETCTGVCVVWYFNPFYA